MSTLKKSTLTRPPENLFHYMFSGRKSKSLNEKFQGLVLFSAQYYKNEKKIIFAENTHLFIIGKFSENWKFHFQGYIFPCFNELKYTKLSLILVAVAGI